MKWNFRNKNMGDKEEKIVKDLTEVCASALEVGFTHSVPMDCSTIELLEEVRQMCAQNTCGQYGHNWACPPGCGSLEECRERVAGYQHAILVQTVGELEDSMDFESMKEAEQRHKKAFLELADQLRASWPRLLPLGAGCCKICKTCAYPDEPCRFPEKRISSMEAYGMVVSDMCKKNQLAYYYGPNTIAYTSCFLLD
jgi:predicted metal-binding protein